VRASPRHTTAAIGAVACIVLCGCSSHGSGGTTGGTPSGTPLPSAGATAGAGAAIGSGAPVGTTASASTGGSAPGIVVDAGCPSTDFKATAHPSSGGGGQQAVVVVVRNVSHESCALIGHPHAWFVSASASRIPARFVRRSGPPEHRVIVGPGEVASTSVWTQNPGVNPSYCQPIRATEVRLLVPATASQPLSAALRISVCSRHEVVGTTAFVPGSTAAAR
jgi:hypothetical protein